MKKLIILMAFGFACSIHGAEKKQEKPTTFNSGIPANRPDDPELAAEWDRNQKIRKELERLLALKEKHLGTVSALEQIFDGRILTPEERAEKARNLQRARLENEQ